MRKIALVLMCVLMGMPGISLADHFSTQIKDKYVLGKGLNIYDDPVIQRDVFVELGRGFYVDLWWSTGLDEPNLNLGNDDEVDWTTGWKGEVGGNCKLDIGIAYFDLTKIFSIEEGDVIQPFAELGRKYELDSRHSFTPYIRAVGLVPIGWDKDARSGAHIFLGLKHDWQPCELLGVSQKFAVMYDTGTLVSSDRGFLGNYDLGLNWKVSKRATVNLPSFKLISPISDLDDGRKTQHVVGGGITFSF